MRARTGRAAGLVAIALLLAPPSPASESEIDEAPAPASATEVQGRLEKQFEAEEKRPPLFPGLAAALADQPAFLRDSTLVLRSRTRYHNVRLFNGERAEAWALGGSLYYRSGWLAETAAVELEYFTSQRLKGDDNRGGTRLLQPGQHGFGVLGIANLRLRWKEWSLTGYRQRVDLPFVNGNDSRMVPNTFEGATLERKGERLNLLAGHLWRWKPRDSDEFLSFTESSGQDESISIAGISWNPRRSTHLGAFSYYIPDAGVGFYAESSWEEERASGVTTRLEVQGGHVRSAGEALLDEGKDTATSQVGLRGSLGWRGLVAQLSATRVSGGDALQSPFGSNSSFLDRMQASFTRANEAAVGLDLSWKLAELGLPALRINWNLTQGWGGEMSDGSRSDRLESDLTFDYRPEEGELRGLWLRLRLSTLYDDREERTRNEIRAMIRYDFDLL